MSNSRLWIGLIPLALLWGVCAAWETPKVESDIRARALAQARVDFPDASVQAQGRDITMSGQSSSAGAPQRTVEQVRQLEGVRLLQARVDERRIARPFVFSAERTADRLLLEGAAPTRAVAAQLAAGAKAAHPEIEVIDRTEPAAGEPEKFASIAEHGVSLVSRLPRGRFVLSDAAYSLHGDAGDAASRKAVLEALRRLPPGATPGQIYIRPPLVSPFLWSARRQGSDILLRGYAPSEEAKRRIATNTPGTPKVVDETEIARGVAEDVFQKMSTAALSALAHLEDGRAEFVGSRLTLAGVTRDELSVEEIGEAARRALPDAVALDVAALRPPRAAPFVLSVARTPEGLALSGFAPDAAAREAVVASARGAAPAVSGVLKIATGHPDGLDYRAAARFAIAQAMRLTTGAVTLRDGKLDIEGVAADEALAAIRGAMLGVVPAGMSAGSLGVRALESSVSAAQATLAPAAQPAAKPDLPSPTVASQPAAAPPAATAPAVGPDAALVEAPPPARSSAPLAGAAARSRSGPVGRGRGSLPQHDLCAAREDGMLLQASILFDNARGLPRPDQGRKLQQIFEVAKGCGAVAVEVAGHTDQVGSRVSNLVLSQIRVAVVIRLLREAGVPLARVREVALGELAPAIPFESTERDRANNRRVSVTIRRVRR